ncbi:hypothetical protein AN958_08634 [Leucoagaricus sp. SymC.cos]|nr:hypothetical protein AN958_08634 [Leucoagaricus sp. SymC.cos]
MMGEQAIATNLLSAIIHSLTSMGLEDGTKIIALVINNPIVMQVFQAQFKAKYYWIIMLPCLLYEINTTIGEITSFPTIKRVIAKCNKLVTFFNSSHYWGGQLSIEAANDRNDSIFTDKSISIPLGQLCLCSDAQHWQHGLSAVPNDIITTVLNDSEFWSQLGQLIKVTKPIVDAIGNLESCEANLADRMLKLIYCTCKIIQISFDADEDDHDFWIHAKKVFNRRFYSMNTPIHSLALFLHPLTQHFAISQVASSCSMQFLSKTALEVALK